MTEKYIVPLLIITAVGSIVDMFQFFWIVRAGWSKIRSSYKARVRAEILAELNRKGPDALEEG